MSHGHPWRWTAMITLVCGVIFRSMSFGSMSNDSSISAKTGSAPERTIAS